MYCSAGGAAVAQSLSYCNRGGAKAGGAKGGGFVRPTTSLLFANLRGSAPCLFVLPVR